MITTIIPTYRRPWLLKRAIKSIMRQTFSDFQICVYDNASGDETYEVVQELMKQDSRIKYHCHSENIGMMGNYLYALSQVETPFFSILSDDDLVFPWFYEKTMKGFELNPEAGFSATSTLILNKNHNFIDSPISKWKQEGRFEASEGVLEMIGKWPVPTTVIFRREALEKVFPDVENQLVWDCDYLMQIAAQFPFVISKEECGIFYAHENSFSNTSHEFAYQEGFVKIAKRFKEYGLLPKRKRGLIVNSLVNRFIYSYLFSYGVKGKFSEAALSLNLLNKHLKPNFRTKLITVLLRISKTLHVHKLLEISWLFSSLKAIRNFLFPRNQVASITNYKRYPGFEEWVKISCSP